jgi:hypothetical protein
MSYDWGPHFIVPSETLNKFSGHVLLREYFDEDLLNKELEQVGLEGTIEYVTNPWYYRRKSTSTWIKIGESENIRENFPVSWDTSTLENGQYEVLGLMHVFVKKDTEKHAIARQNVVEVTIEN